MILFLFRYLIKAAIVLFIVAIIAFFTLFSSIELIPLIDQQGIVKLLESYNG